MKWLISGMLADLGLEQLNPARGPLGKNLREHLSDVFLVLAAILALTLGLLIWAKYLRKSKATHARSRILSGSPSPSKSDEAEDRRSHRRKRRHRKRKADFRERNPTLAETGGLPPMRSEDRTPGSPVP